MDRRTFLSGIALGAFAPPLAAQAPPMGKTARIGILTLRPPAVPSPLTEALMQGLRERGYVEGKNLVIEYPMPVDAMTVCLSLPPTSCAARWTSS